MQRPGSALSKLKKQQQVLNVSTTHKPVEKKVYTTDGFIKNRDFEGLCFVNLADFDVLYGHRRNPLGYGDSIEEFDKDLKEILAVLKDDDCLMITADHGNDPTWWGTDHTRERVPLITYSPSYQNGRLIPERDTFGCIGKTVLKNFSVTPSENEIGDPIDELLGD